MRIALTLGFLLKSVTAFQWLKIKIWLAVQVTLLLSDLIKFLIHTIEMTD